MANNFKKMSDAQLSGWLLAELDRIQDMLAELEGRNEGTNLAGELCWLNCHIGNLLSWAEDIHPDIHQHSERAISMPECHEFRRQEASMMDDMCYDCGDDSDWFMVDNDMWDKHGCGIGILCSKCLEDRIGRPLVPDDLTECKLNDMSATARRIRGLPPLPKSEQGDGYSDKKLLN